MAVVSRTPAPALSGVTAGRTVVQLRRRLTRSTSEATDAQRAASTGQRPASLDARDSVTKKKPNPMPAPTASASAPRSTPRRSPGPRSTAPPEEHDGGHGDGDAGQRQPARPLTRSPART